MTYLNQLAAAFREAGDPEIALGQAAYLKDQFEFFGLKSPVRRAVQKEFVQQHGWPSLEDAPKLSIEAYGWPQREMHYFGMERVQGENSISNCWIRWFSVFLSNYKNSKQIGLPHLFPGLHLWQASRT